MMFGLEHLKLDGAGERTVARLVRRRDLHQVNVTRLQLLQKSHGVCTWNKNKRELLLIYMKFTFAVEKKKKADEI